MGGGLGRRLETYATAECAIVKLLGNLARATGNWIGKGKSCKKGKS